MYPALPIRGPQPSFPTPMPASRKGASNEKPKAANKVISILLSDVQDLRLALSIVYDPEQAAKINTLILYIDELPDWSHKTDVENGWRARGTNDDDTILESLEEWIRLKHLEDDLRDSKEDESLLRSTLQTLKDHGGDLKTVYVGAIYPVEGNDKPLVKSCGSRYRDKYDVFEDLGPNMPEPDDFVAFQKIISALGYCEIRPEEFIMDTGSWCLPVHLTSQADGIWLGVLRRIQRLEIKLWCRGRSIDSEQIRAFARMIESIPFLCHLKINMAENYYSRVFNECEMIYDGFALDRTLIPDEVLRLTISNLETFMICGELQIENEALKAFVARHKGLRSIGVQVECGLFGPVWCLIPEPPSDLLEQEVWLRQELEIPKGVAFRYRQGIGDEGLWFP